MAANPEEIEERIAFLERESERKGVLIDHQQAQSNKHLATINQHLSQQDATTQTIAQSTDKRFEHVYGELADIKADTAEIRNLLAALVARLEK